MFGASLLWIAVLLVGRFFRTGATPYSMFPDGTASVPPGFEPQCTFPQDFGWPRFNRSVELRVVADEG